MDGSEGRTHQRHRPHNPSTSHQHHHRAHGGAHAGDRDPLASHHQRPVYNRNGNGVHSPHRRGDHHLSEVVTTVPAFRVTPHAASQSNQAQHGATVVRSGSTSTVSSNGGRGTVQFYSSVQRKGGAFTDSEGATLRQLGGLRNMQKRTRERVETPLTAAGNLSRAALVAMEERYRENKALQQQADFEAGRAQAMRKRGRFDVDSAPSTSESSSRASSSEEQRHARQRAE